MSNLKQCDLCGKIIAKYERYFVINGYKWQSCSNFIDDYQKDVCLLCLSELDSSVIINKRTI